MIYKNDMKQLKLQACLIIVLMLSACNTKVNPAVPPAPTPDPVPPTPELVFTAVTEPYRDSEQGYNDVIWKANDAICVFETASQVSRYEIMRGVGSTTAKFRKNSSAKEDNGDKFNSNIAFYPYVENIEVSQNEESYTISNVSFSSSFSSSTETDTTGSFPMAAVTESINDSTLNFRNICGILRINLADENHRKINKLILKGNSDEILSGTTSVTVSATSAPVIAPFSEGEKTVTLECPETILSSEGTSFEAILPATYFSKGFSITVVSEDGTETIANYSSECTVAASSILAVDLSVPVQGEDPDDDPAQGYLTFTSSGENTLSIKFVPYESNFNVKKTQLYYSYDAEKWTEWNPTSTDVNTTSTYPELEFSSSKPLYISGMHANGEGFTAGNNLRMRYTRQFVIGGEGKVRCSGNIMTLINREAPSKEIPVQDCFYDLFKDCKQLVSGPALPAINLKLRCYLRMFAGCSSLEEAPALPAMELAKGCYSEMFNGCSSLSKLPDLPATQLAESCYSYMFSGTAAEEAPVLPATVMVKSCYYYMFSSCKKLVRAPELPATVMAEECYRGMFYSCSSLEKAPELPARDLVKNCYHTLFDSCPLIREIKAWFVISKTDFYDYYGTKSSLYTSSWLKGVANTGTFYGNPENDWIPYNGGLSRFAYTVPKDWSIQEWVRNEQESI